MRRTIAWLIWGAVAFFLVNLAGVIGAVVVNSVGERWFGSWLPQGWTTRWYASAWTDFGLFQVLVVTLEVALLVVAISVLVACPPPTCWPAAPSPAAGSST